MDLDDDELWFTKYKRNYVSKDKIKNKINELEKAEKIYREIDDCAIYWEIIGEIQLLKDLLKE